MDNASFWRGAFCGLVTGALITAFTTPRTGSEMRSTVKEKAGKAKTKVGEWRRKPEQNAE